MNHIKIDPHQEGFVAEIKIQKKEGKTTNQKFSNQSFPKLVEEILSQFKITYKPTSSFAWVFTSTDDDPHNYGKTYYV